MLNLVENWNLANIFIFFTRRGIILLNNEADYELSILPLHLLQFLLMYINTLLLQQIIKEEFCILTLDDKKVITSFSYHYIN